MLAVPLVPHHHHADGVICMKNDLSGDPLCSDHQQCTNQQECAGHHQYPSQQQCPGHHQHNPENDACCNDECLTRFQTSVPASHIDLVQPQHGFVAILFTDYIIECLLKPQEQRIKDYYVYRESLHGTNITRAFSLRGPPCLFV